VIEEGLAGLVDDDHFFDLLADDVVFEFIITVRGYPRRVAGRGELIELYRATTRHFPRSVLRPADPSWRRLDRHAGVRVGR